MANILKINIIEMQHFTLLIYASKSYGQMQTLLPNQSRKETPLKGAIPCSSPNGLSFKVSHPKIVR